VFSKLGAILFLYGTLSLSAQNFEEILMVAIKQGGTAKAAISGVIKTIDSTINYNLFLIAKWFSYREITKENNILITTS
jgi:hypothetical protein